MVERKTQYERNPRLKLAYKKHFRVHGEYLRRLSAWLEVLKNPSEHTLIKIADLLARLNLEPNEYGIPRGDWPPITKTDPRILLDAFKESVAKRGGEWADEQDTLAWKIDVLSAASFVWAGVALADVLEAYPRVSESEIEYLLLHADLETFWNRPGVGWSAADIRERWERDENLIADEKTMGRLLRNTRGCT